MAKLDIAAIRARAEAATAGPWFPVLDAGYSVPWQYLTPFEEQAKRNHDQSLSHLASRGGLDSLEILLVINGMGLRQIAEAKKRWPNPRDAVMQWVHEQHAADFAAERSALCDRVEALEAALREVIDLASICADEDVDGRPDAYAQQRVAKARAALDGES